MSEEINVLNILKNLRKRLNLILSITFLSIVTVWFLLNFVITPTFQATSTIWIEEAVVETSTGDGGSEQADHMLINSYVDLLKSPEVLEETGDRLGLNYSVVEIRDLVTVTHASNPQVLNIMVSTGEGKEAVEIANAMTSVLQESLMEWLGTNNVTIITKASEETVDSSLGENIIFDLGMAGAFGLIVGILIAFIIEMLSTTLKTNKRKRRRKKDKEVKLQTVFK